MSIFNTHATGLDALDPPRGGTQEKNVAGQAFDGKVFIQSTDDLFFRLGDDRIIGRFGNCAA